MWKTLVIVLTIVFSLSLSGCITPNGSKSIRWPMPEEPAKKQVQSKSVRQGEEFSPQTDGIFLDETSAGNLLFNIDELDAYIEKLEMLIDEMKEYYKAK